MTAPQNHWTYAIHIKNTWGKRCDTLLFVSSKNDSKLPAVAVFSEGEGRKYLWHKTQATYKLIYEKYLDKADWFVRADDDSYIIIENLKFLLKDYDPKESLYFGQRLKSPNVQKGFMTGGAGVVLSKEAVKRLVEKAFPKNTKNCSTDDYSAEDDVLIGTEEIFKDVWVGRQRVIYYGNHSIHLTECCLTSHTYCLMDVGITVVDTRDSLNRHRFNHLPPGRLLFGTAPSWYSKWLYYPPQPSGYNCCSEAAISFHYLQPKDMYLLEYLLYHVKVFRETKNDLQWSRMERMSSRP